MKVLSWCDPASNDGPGRPCATGDEVVNVVVTQISEHCVHGVLPAVLVDTQVVQSLDPVDLGVKLFLEVCLEPLDEVAVVADPPSQQDVVRGAVDYVFSAEPVTFVS